MGSNAESSAGARRLSSRARSIERSPIRLMYDMAQRHDGSDLVHLEIGEPDFDTPPHVVEAANEAATAGKTHYTSNAGLPELREAIATDLPSGVEADPENEIVVTTGAMEALLLGVLAVVDEGEEVILPTPCWPNYVTQARIAGAEPVEVPLPRDEGFALDPEAVTGAITDDTGAVVLNSPSNPTGQVYDPDAVRAVVEAAAENGAYVIADEVYRELVYGRQPTGIAGYADESDTVLTVGSCSKTYAMTGWRVGWLVAPKPIADAAIKTHESVTACASSVSQHAALAALTGPRDPVEEMRSAFAERREYVLDRVADLPDVTCPAPNGAFYAFLDFSHLDEPSIEISKRLLNDYGVVTAPGSGFGTGAEGYVRISFANSLDRIERGFDRIETMLETEGTDT